jgi:hypothetical protein
LPGRPWRGITDGVRSERHRLTWPLVAAAFAGEILPLWRRGYGIGGKVVVRCRGGHLFRTLWVPGASVKALRLGPWRLQRCPAGAHWSIVTPVSRDTLTEGELATAHAVHDLRLP